MDSPPETCVREFKKKMDQNEIGSAPHWPDQFKTINQINRLSTPSLWMNL
jgi:hypothetical protein